MSAKAQSLPVAVRPHIRMWQVFAVVIVLAIAATLALTLGRSSGSTTPASFRRPTGDLPRRP